MTSHVKRGRTSMLKRKRRTFKVHFSKERTKLPTLRMISPKRMLKSKASTRSTTLSMLSTKTRMRNWLTSLKNSKAGRSK